MGSNNTRKLAVSALEQIFRTDRYAETVLDSQFLKEQLSIQDRRFISELVYGTLRWLGKLDWILGSNYNGKWLKVPEKIRRLLEVALYQILYLDRTPDFAVVNEAVNHAKQVGGHHWGNTANGLLRTCIRKRDDYEEIHLDDPELSLSVNWSHPLWLVRKLAAWVGLKRTRSICMANNKRPYTGLRVNTLRTTREEVLSQLLHEGFTAEASELMAHFIRLCRPGNIRELKCFNQGLVTVQDESAGLPAQLADPKQGDVIIDLAAAPGGKSTYMAELGRDRAFIIAADVSSSRIQSIVENRNRLGLQNLHLLAADTRTFCLRDKADKVLLDAPCSGIGVIRRRGELRWRKTEKQVHGLTELQSALLHSAASHVKTGGRLVYSTCTILPEENEDIVSAFLKRNRNFVLERPSAVPGSLVDGEGYVRTWPDIHDMDGSFAAAMIRQE